MNNSLSLKVWKVSLEFTFTVQDTFNEFEPRLCHGCQTQDVNISSDCSFIKCSAFGRENRGSIGYDFKSGGPVS